jgi:hypothetical protein
MESKRVTGYSDYLPEAINFLLGWWLRWYRKRPTLTALATFLVLLSGALGAYLDYEEQQKIELESAALSYSEQIAELDQVETSLRRLATFVEGQRQKVEQAEEILDDLEKKQRQRLAAAESEVEDLETKRKRLEPLLDADRQIVNSIFALQREQESADVWRQRWWGFGFGVAASILGSILVHAMIVLVKKRRRKF